MKIGISTSSFGNPDDTPLRRLEDEGVELVLNPYGRRLSREEVIQFVQDLDGLVAGVEPLDRGVLESGSQLKAVARVGIGMDNVDQEAARELGIAVSNTPVPPTNAVAELTLAAALYLIRDLHRHLPAMRSGRWEKRVSGSLTGATVHVIGFGRIGRQTAKMFKAFGSLVLATDPYWDQKNLVKARRVSLEEGLGEADVVTLHAAGSDVIIGAPELDRMKQGAVLLNSARGGLVDEMALLQVLKAEKLHAAWFDSFWEEPYKGPLLEEERFFASPHVSTYTGVCRRNMELEAVENILRDLNVPENN